jgi:hypothetical protein
LANEIDKRPKNRLITGFKNENNQKKTSYTDVKQVIVELPFTALCQTSFQ